MNLKRKPFLKDGKEKTYFHYQNAAVVLSDQICSALPDNRERQILIVCIGTDRSTGDALGPIVGTKLKERAVTFYDVYGTLEDPVHAVNLEEKLKQIYLNHFNPFIIGVDASLGKASNVGMITFGEGPVLPGAGVNKQLPPVGDVHLTGIVNVSGFMEYFVLQNTRLNLVMQMANAITEGIYSACRKVKFPLPDQATYQ